MESTTPPLATANPGNGIDNQTIAQDPLALPNEHHVGYTNSTESQDQPTTTTTQSNTNNSNSDKNLDGSMTTTNTNSNNNGAIYSNNGAESSHHQGMQYDTATTASQIGNSHHHQHFNDVRQLNHLHQQMSMPQQQQQHETHKTFSHSIENLSKTTEKCPSNDMKM